MKKTSYAKELTKQAYIDENQDLKGYKKSAEYIEILRLEKESKKALASSKRAKEKAKQSGKDWKDSRGVKSWVTKMNNKQRKLEIELENIEVKAENRLSGEVLTEGENFYKVMSYGDIRQNAIMEDINLESEFGQDVTAIFVYPKYDKDSDKVVYYSAVRRSVETINSLIKNIYKYINEIQKKKLGTSIFIVDCVKTVFGRKTNYKIDIQ